MEFQILYRQGQDCRLFDQVRYVELKPIEQCDEEVAWGSSGRKGSGRPSTLPRQRLQPAMLAAHKRASSAGWQKADYLLDRPERRAALYLESGHCMRLEAIGRFGSRADARSRGEYRPNVRMATGEARPRRRWTVLFFDYGASAFTKKA